MTAATAATDAARLFRHDIQDCSEDIDVLRHHLAETGFPLTPVRILEILVWTETEPRGDYRGR